MDNRLTTTMLYQTLSDMKPKRSAAYCIVNIDDALMIFRMMRREGLRVVRQRAILTGEKNSQFHVYSKDVHVGSIQVDTWRHTPRGKIVMVDKPRWTPEVLETSRLSSITWLKA